jgi:hypothetical protein
MDSSSNNDSSNNMVTDVIGENEEVKITKIVIVGNTPSASNDNHDKRSTGRGSSIDSSSDSDDSSSDDSSSSSDDSDDSSSSSSEDEESPKPSRAVMPCRNPWSVGDSDDEDAVSVGPSSSASAAGDKKPTKARREAPARVPLVPISQDEFERQCAEESGRAPTKEDTFKRISIGKVQASIGKVYENMLEAAHLLHTHASKVTSYVFDQIEVSQPMYLHPILLARVAPLQKLMAAINKCNGFAIKGALAAATNVDRESAGADEVTKFVFARRNVMPNYHNVACYLTAFDACFTVDVKPAAVEAFKVLRPSMEAERAERLELDGVHRRATEIPTLADTVKVDILTRLLTKAEFHNAEAIGIFRENIKTRPQPCRYRGAGHDLLVGAVAAPKAPKAAKSSTGNSDGASVASSRLSSRTGSVTGKAKPAPARAGSSEADAKRNAEANAKRDAKRGTKRPAESRDDKRPAESRDDKRKEDKSRDAKRSRHGKGGASDM